MLSHLLGSLSPAGPFLYGFLIFAWGVYIFETYLDIRQHRMFQVKIKPEKITYLTQEEFEKAQKYGHDKSTFGFFTSLKDLFKLTIYLLIGYYPTMWYLAGDLLEQRGYDASHAMKHLALFYILDATLDTILSLPFSAYSIFVIEEKHGFNKQTLGLFVSDTIKGLALNCIIAPPLFALFILVIEAGGPNFYLYCTALLLIVQLIAVPVYSNLIQPLFNKVEPLPVGELRTNIEQLASSIDFPLTKLSVIDGSKRSSHSNAYFYGFWKSKAIVLFDTLLTQCTNPQILGVLGHELGHWRLNHTIKNLIVGQIQFLVMFYTFGTLIHNDSLYTDFGFSTLRPTYIGLLLFSFIYSPVQHVTAYLMHLLSRRFEFEADRFAMELGFGTSLMEALITLQKKNKGTPISDPYYSEYHHSHPPILQRLQAIEEAMNNKKNE